MLIWIKNGARVCKCCTAPLPHDALQCDNVAWMTFLHWRKTLRLISQLRVRQLTMQEISIQTENQRLILETVKRFVEAEVRPRAAKFDAEQDPEKSFSWEIVEKADEVGIRTMTLSEEWGGLGTDSLTTLCLPKSLSDIGWVRISEWTNVDYNHCGKMPGFAGERT